jgi:hypothetical protein
MEAGFMAFHPFHSLSFPSPAFGRQSWMNRYATQCKAPHPPRNAYRDQLSVSAIWHQSRIIPDENGVSRYLSEICGADQSVSALARYLPSDLNLPESQDSQLNWWNAPGRQIGTACS